MKTLSVVNYLKNTFTPEVEKVLARNIQAGIERNDLYSAWYTNMTPLELHCHNFSSVFVNCGKIVEHEENAGYNLAECFMPTTKEFYPSFHCNGEDYCHATMTTVESNLDLYTIHLRGNDDYSVSFDIIGRDAAYNEWYRLLSVDYITDELVSDYYFSN